MPGLEKILRGVLRYRQGGKKEMLQHLENFKANPKTTALHFTCMDSRLQPSQINDTRPGDMFVFRNPGNLIPHARHYKGMEALTGEPGALELGCIRSNIRDVAVCGHADCKAMAGLLELKGRLSESDGTPLELWLKKHGADSLEKYLQLTPENNFQGPLKFEGAVKEQDFEAVIDPEKKFSEVDKLSQVNCLQQITNISSYPFLKEHLINDRVRLHAFWFNLHSGDMYMFSQSQKQFLEVNEDTYDVLAAET